MNEFPRRTEVDGVPVLLAPGGGPMRAGLMFRVGRADETAATIGVTHLVEHLALYNQGGLDHDTNGMTGLTTTQFVTQGSPEAVTAFLHAVCTGLRKLPLDRLDVERQILRTEAEHRPESIGVALAVYRYGARDYGLAGLPEWGTHSLTAADVAEWVQTRFTRANAALWIAGDGIPPGLHLDLPDGERRTLPPESSALPMTPAWFAQNAPAIVLESPVPRVPAATAYTRLLERGLFRELRHERGLSYVATAAYTTDGRQQARLTAIADGRPDRLNEVLDGFLAQIHHLATGDVAADELELVRTRELAALDRPDVEADLLSRRATDLLCGFVSSTTEELREGFRTLTAADVRVVASDVKRSALLMTPRFGFGPPPGFEPAPTGSRFAVTGTRHRSRTEPDTVLVLATDGVSVVRPHSPSTVLFDECVALLRFPDGARHLLGADGVAVSVEPTLYSLPDDAQSRIDAAVPGSAHVDLPPRDPERIPRRAWANGLRTRASAMALSVRMRLDRYAMFRGGIRNVVLATTLLLTSTVSVVLAIALHVSLLGWTAAALFAFQLWRRRARGHW
ncbi:insulinase family protein [Dactylosporangium sp. NPDC005572]|uniref:M16 family metallopeptidase n=1 Tax=Dactylosporangium sp. NPDC005572 TaxID=3156889 RepID=UPI0033B0B422